MVAKQLRASLVALFGQLHPGRWILRAKHLRKVELPFAVPPTMSLGDTPQLWVLR